MRAVPGHLADDATGCNSDLGLLNLVIFPVIGMYKIFDTALPGPKSALFFSWQINKDQDENGHDDGHDANHQHNVFKVHPSDEH